jgi:negative regulator of flagellin synthesis FlgM
MSFASGIGSLQQTVNSSTPTNTKSVAEANRPGGVTVLNEPSFENANKFDQADLSSVGGVVAQTLEGSDIRYAKVASLQQTIAAGNYSVSSSDVAGKIIEGLLK